MSGRLPIVILVVTAFLAALIVLINTSGGGVALPPSYVGVPGVAPLSTSTALHHGSEEEEEDVRIVMTGENNARRHTSTLLHEEVKYSQYVLVEGDHKSSDFPSDSGSVFSTIKESKSAKRAEFPISKLMQVVSVNSERCQNGQPLTSPIGPYAKCPLPGLNNVLYTQINRWYCAYRDGADIELRDRSCTKRGVAGGQTIEPFRFSSFLTVKYEVEEGGDRVEEKMAIAANGARDGSSSSKRSVGATHWGGGGTNASICWSDIPGNKQTIPTRCEWRDIPSFYATEMWWRARAMIDFHEQYYRVAAHYVHKVFPHSASVSGPPKGGGKKPWMPTAPFVGVHVRRGDYFTHCHHIKNQRIPKWISFEKTPHLIQDPAGRCFPSDDQMISAISKVAAKLHLAQQTARDNTYKGCYGKKVSQNNSIEQNGREPLGITTGPQRVSVVNVLVATNHPHELKDLKKRISTLTFAVTQDNELLEIGAERVHGANSAAPPPLAATSNNGNAHDGVRTTQSKLLFSINLVLFDDKRLLEIQTEENGGGENKGYKIRDVDRTIVEMTMLSMASYFIFNAYSSFSGTIFEQASIHGRVSRSGGNVTNVYVW